MAASEDVVGVVGDVFDESFKVRDALAVERNPALALRNVVRLLREVALDDVDGERELAGLDVGFGEQETQKTVLAKLA